MAHGRRGTNGRTASIQAHEFAVTTVPEATICKECDLRMLCAAEGVIERGVAA
jgi:hypothetical protein